MIIENNLLTPSQKIVAKNVDLKVGYLSVKKRLFQSSALDAILGDGIRDTTAQHNSHLYDANCQICLSKTKREADIEKKKMQERETAKRLEREQRMVSV